MRRSRLIILFLSIFIVQLVSRNKRDASFHVLGEPQDDGYFGEDM